jgi:D-alanyl-D-alanine carboxypeptidase
MSGKCRSFLLCLTFLFAGALIACGTSASPEAPPTLKMDSTVTPAPTDTAANTLETQLDQLMRESYPDFSGTILVAQAGADAIVLSYGFANREHNVLNTPNTKFAIGSITKSFTGMAIMILEERGFLSVDDPICEHFTNCPDAWQAVTIHHLLTHTSGIPSYTDLLAGGQIDAELGKEYTTDQVIAFFDERPLDFPPGSQWHYNNSGYFLLGAIIENASSQSYDAFVQENILQPLGMTETGYNYDHLIVENRASGYSQEESEDINAPHWDVSTQYSAGGLYSTVGDLYKWDQAFYSNDLVSAKTLDKIFSAAVTTSDGSSRYGYGWLVFGLSGHQVVEHPGGLYGFVSQLTRYPEDQVTIIILSNYDVMDTTVIGRNLAAVVFDHK